MEGHDRAGEIDLGSDHFMRYSVWSPDRALNPQYEGIPDIDPCGITIRHVKADGTWCHGALLFDSPPMHTLWPGRAMWTVEALEPLTLSPSILCQCGDHGFIRGGRWVSA